MLLVSTSSFNWYWLHRIFSFVKEASYDWIDLVLSKNNYDTWSASYLKSLIKEFDVPILSITAPNKWMNEKKVDLIVDIAKEVWAQNITFFPPYLTDKNTTWYTKYLPRVKRDTHLSISVANVEQKLIFFVIPEYKNASLHEIKRITGDTALDLASIDLSSGLDIIKALKTLWSSIKNIYFSDRHWPKKWILPWQAGGGTSYLPLESFLMKLKATWYWAFITLKVTPKELWVWTDERVLQNLEYFKNYYKKHFLDTK